MKEGVKYPDYVGVSDVTTQSYEHMPVSYTHLTLPTSDLV